jgi:F-type H+-transporting ATPase subunit delta
MDKRRRAIALFDLAIKNKRIQDVLLSLESLELFLNDDTIQSFLSAPHLALDQKMALVNALKLEPQTQIWFELLIKDHGVPHFSQIKAIWIQLLQEKEGHKVVDICSAVELNSTQKSALEKRLQSYFNAKQMTCYYEVDPSLVGGLKIMHQGLSLDHSILNMMNELETNL